jgi:hypothetical protein
LTIDLATVGQQTGIPGVLSHDSFDKAVADAGGYCVTLAVRTSVGRGTIVKPIQSVGASQRRPGLFYFAIDERFRNWPGFGLVWPSPPEVTGVTAVPIEILSEPAQIGPADVAAVEKTFRMLEKVAEENGLPPEGEDS